MHKREKAEAKYLEFNPFAEDRDVSIECYKVDIVTTRKPQACAASWLLDAGHVIKPGSRARRERAKVDGEFGSSYCCLPCLEKLIKMNQ